MRVALLLGAYAALATLAYVFLGTSVAPCLGGPGIDNTACAEAWQASRPWWERLLDTPYPEIAGFLVASVLTIWLSRRHRA